MATSQQLRIQFREWLITHALDPEIADAIMETVPPFDWSEIARSTEVTAQFGGVYARFEQIDQRFEQVDQRFEQIDQRFEQIDQRFEVVENRLEVLDQRMARVETRLDTIELRLDSLRDELHSMSRTVALGAVGFMLTMVLATASMLGTVIASGALS